MDQEVGGILSHRVYPAVLLGALLVFAAILAIGPFDRKDWALENALLLGALVLLVATRRAFPLSRVSYTLIFVFFCLHTVGAHYTYAEVPYERWLGGFLASDRNHYDRFVHFSYGLLLAYPVREVFMRVADVKGFWGYYLPLDVVMATSMLYEIIEWGAAEVFGGDLGIAYLGTQGDVWDAQKDMGMATIGAVLAMLVTAAINRRYQRDFNQEWAASLRVKHRKPLGEDELRRLREESGR